MIANIISGIIAGIISTLLICLFTSLWNVRAKRILRIQSKRLQSYLQSINNDITWGYEDYREDYYDNLISKIPHVYHCIDEAEQAISLLDFRLLGRRKYVFKQLRVLTKEMDYIMSEVEAADRETEKVCRLKELKERYQTTGSNILLIRAEFLEELICLKPVESSIEKVAIDDDEETRLKIVKELRQL